MRKIVWIFSLLALLLLAIPQPIRLHVIANSDSAEDQATKLEVRDAVLEVMNDGLSGAKTRAEARSMLLSSGKIIQGRTEEVLREAGADYGAQLRIGWSDFPDRVYGEKFFPAGKYEALKIVLGDGGGQNWWCVMYPPLCLGNLQGAANASVQFKSGIAEFIDYIGG